MKRLKNISTKTGDKGQTSLANGKRVSKTSQVISAIGTVDELNSWLGLVQVKMTDRFIIHKRLLFEVQNALFDLGAELASYKQAGLKIKNLNHKTWQTNLNNLETVSLKLQEAQAKTWPTGFILPGGTELGARLDVARTVCRRAEREVVTAKVKLHSVWFKYLNRLSDYLFVLRCYVNHEMKYKEKKY